MKLSFAIKLFGLSILTSMMMFTSAFALSTGTTSATSLNLRQEPNTEASILAQIPNSGKFAVHYVADNGWAKVSYNGDTGFISSEFLTAIEDCDYFVGNGIVTIESGTLNVRNYPSETGEVVTRLSAGQIVEVTGVKQGWYQVNINGKACYVHPDYLQITQRDATVSRGGDVNRTASGTSSVRQQMIDFGATQLGDPYVYGATGPNSFDCSGFVTYVINEFGYSLPRSSASMYSAITKIDRSELLPGDLVFFSTSSSGSKVGHVGIYVGGGDFIHGSSGAGQVTYSNLADNYYAKHYIGSGRIIFD